MSPEALRALCPHCSSDILRAAPDCWLCGKPLPSDFIERALVEEALRAPMTVRGTRDLESSHFGLVFLIACLAAGGFTLSPKFGAMFLLLLLPAAGWLLMDYAPAKQQPSQEQSESSAAAWTVAALVLLPLSLALALASTGIVAFSGASHSESVR